MHTPQTAKCQHALPQQIPRRSINRTESSGREVELVTNAYSLIASPKATSKIFEYELTITPSIGCKDLPAKVLHRTYVSRSIRKLLMATIVPQLNAEDKYPIGSVLIEPNLETIFSTKQFKTTAADADFKFENLAVQTDLLTSLRIDVSIKFSRFFKSNPKAYSTVLLSSIIHHQLQIDMLRYGSVYYMMNETIDAGNSSTQLHQQRRSLSTLYPNGPLERLDLISQHLMGVSISGAKRSTDDQSLVVVNCTHSYITKSYRLIDLLASFIANKPVDDVVLLHSLNESQENLQRFMNPVIGSIKGSEEWFKTFCSILDGFKCQAADDREQKMKINLRFDLTDEPAKQLLLDENMTVQQHYRQIGIHLNYPNLPCLKSRSSRHSLLPFELCSLLSGQKVPIFRLSTAARAHLTKVNKPKPSFSKHSSCKARDGIAELNKHQFRMFGIEMSKSPVEAKGRTLIKPTLQYRNVALEPERDFWESGAFCKTVDLVGNWFVVDTTNVLSSQQILKFFYDFSPSAKRFGFQIGQPLMIKYSKQDIVSENISMENIIRDCNHRTKGRLRFVMFIIDSSSTTLNRMIHLAFDEHPHIDATCLRAESIQNQRQHRSIFRTLVHKLNARLGGTNVSYHKETLSSLGLGSLGGLMIVGLDVTHPDNELNGVSIVGCAYTLSSDLFRHRSLVWPQTARVEIINRMDTLMQKLLSEYQLENNGCFPSHIIVYRDGVSHEEFERVRNIEINKASTVIEEQAKTANQPKPNLSYIIAQKRHTLRFFQLAPSGGGDGDQVNNPPGGTLINQGVVVPHSSEFYLYSNTSPQATARPLHYHVLVDGLGIEKLQKLTYYLCFNFGKCSISLSMPSSLRYAHNAAYDARNRVIASKEFQKNKFYTTKFFC